MCTIFCIIFEKCAIGNCFCICVICFLSTFSYSTIRCTFIPWFIFNITQPIVIIILVVIKKLALICIKTLIFTYNLLNLLFSRLLYFEVSMLQALNSCWTLLWVYLEHPFYQVDCLKRSRWNDISEVCFLIMWKDQVYICG